eukprot:ANDGO_07120.mRNA.2 Nucleolar GTP-binding protein 1
MVVYNFKKIQPVPFAKDFIDIVLTRTQRGTPTVIHKGYEISRIRRFYMRKVRFTQQNYDEKLESILTEFPRMDDVHPFYADLMNILYDKDHYKLALGQLATAKNLIDKISKDYVRLLKYGDSLYRCKQLKRAALGRMCTLMRKQGPSLQYLEQVRQHLARLPTIEPNTRTLIICGYPNVGKSSFMKKITRADVEVQPYPFTTRSLFVGHTDYKYLQWQVIDTPGILDKPLEERNTIEMQSITALAHLRAAIMYFMDLSEGCGYSIAEQVNLFHQISPLFHNKPVMIVINKTDKRTLEDLSPEEATLIEKMRTAIPSPNGQPLPLLSMSTFLDNGVDQVKNDACELLLQHRIENKLRSKKGSDVLTKIHVATPKERQGATRGAFIPESVTRQRKLEEDGIEMPEKKLAKDIEREQGGPGRFVFDVREQYLLDNPEWKHDAIPEIMDGMNVADFIDEDILKRLDELEEEEGLRLAAEAEEEDESDVDEDTRKKIREVRRQRKIIVSERRLRDRSLGRNKHLAQEDDDEGDNFSDDSETKSRSRTRSRSVGKDKLGRKRTRSVADDAIDAAQDEMDREGESVAKRARSRSKSVVPGEAGLKDVKVCFAFLICVLFFLLFFLSLFRDSFTGMSRFVAAHLQRMTTCLFLARFL